MRFFVFILFTVFAAWLMEFVIGSWTGIVAAALISGQFFWNQKGKAFGVGFVSIFLFWLCLALFLDFRNEHILSQRMAALLKLPFSFLFILVAAVLGGIVGGVSAWCGAAIGSLFFAQKEMNKAHPEMIPE